MNKWESISQTYLEYILVGGATVCVVRNIGDYPIFLHSNCPHRHRHLFPSQDGCVQHVCVLQGGKSSIFIPFDKTAALLTVRELMGKALDCGARSSLLPDEC